MFEKILIANRGEIACRIQRTAQRLGYRTVAVYSEADAGAPHVSMADEAVCIGAPPAAESYLNIEALLQAAQRSGADAVHPGYGFLSERADFAEACASAGLVFIGPPPAAIRAMGDKALAKRRMIEAGVPCAPGYLGDDQSEARLAAEAQALGLPLLVKAVAGGGGRGMRLVRDLSGLPEALAGARREALSAFGDGTLMLERLIDDGRHIEIQVFCDSLGHALHLGERDCTAQRRRQKVIEEAPSPIVGPELRARMGRDAVAAAQAVGYVGAGTVEFIVDGAGRHYFLEMNTRLQVEHPVTECITGLDLVEWQLRVAEGRPLPLAQDELRLEGHAIELRLYAEDPYDGWKPQTGRIAAWEPQRCSVRVDHGIAAGGEVTPYYDAMLAKFIAHGRDRDDAIRRLLRALAEAPLLGLQTNARFLADLLQHPQFRQAQMTTTRLDEWAAAGEPLLQRPAAPEAAWALAAALLAGNASARPASVARFELSLQSDGHSRVLQAPPADVELLSHDGLALCYVQGGVQRRALALVQGGSVHLALPEGVFTFTEPSPYPRTDAAADPASARAPVAGVVAHLAVAVGDVVKAGQPLVCVEAMKMELWQHAGAAGTVRAIHVQAKDAVAAGALLVELELAPT
ncbi:MAG: ATP-grasp domain-containing protein [Proteobacteria bacterium]|nr:ATP-grasp domain-containing protein [Pseudomonadota bacterium]